ncbi:MAG: hypothetical protein KBD24_00030 [Candidatus Pacebacteria bacterium]|nr:hypothetical protein [Candidatus Paceibacterota bacterium]
MKKENAIGMHARREQMRYEAGFLMQQALAIPCVQPRAVVDKEKQVDALSSKRLSEQQKRVFATLLLVAKKLFSGRKQKKR